MKKQNYISMTLMVIAVLYVSCLLISNLIAGKMWMISETITLPAAVILFPVTYIIGDVFTEVYGFQKARAVIWLGFFVSFFAVVIYMVTIALPAPAFFQDQEAYRTVLSTTPRVAVASLAGYLAGEFSNSVILSKMKVKMEGKHLWMRTILSTVVGEGLDSVLFITISFAGTMETKQLLFMILFQYLFKVLYETICTPFTYLVVKKLKKAEGEDVFDEGVKYRLLGRVR